MLKNPPFDKLKADNKKELGRKAIRLLSRDLQESLSRDLIGEDKSRFDKALNALKLDDKTSASLLADLKKETPGLRPGQAEKLVARCFRRQVNTLRCLGQQVLLTVLDEVSPGVAKAAAEAAASAEAAEAAGEAKQAGKQKGRGEKRWRRRKEAAAPAAVQPAQAVVAEGGSVAGAVNGNLMGATSSTAAAEAPAEAVRRLRAELCSGGAASTCICVLLDGPLDAAAALARALAAEPSLRAAPLAALGAGPAWRAFAEALGTELRARRLLPTGDAGDEAGDEGEGGQLRAGASEERCREVFWLLGDLYLALPSSPASLPSLAAAARGRGAHLVPLLLSGQASSDLLGKRPAFASERHWSLLASGALPAAEAAEAARAIAADFVAGEASSSAKRPRLESSPALP